MTVWFIAFGFGVIVGAILPRLVAAIERALEDEYYGRDRYGDPLTGLRARREAWWQEDERS